MKKYNVPEIITKLDINGYFREYNSSYTTGKTDALYTVWNRPFKKD